LNKGTTHVKDLMLQYIFIEGKDYRVSNVRDSAPNGGCTHKNEYYLHPRAFKKCLMRSLKTQKYADYYLLLEECIKYYDAYQNKLKENYYITLLSKKEEDLKFKDDKIDKLIHLNEKTNKQNEEIIQQNEKFKKIIDKINLKLDDTLDELYTAKEDRDKIIDQLEIADEKLDETNIKLNLVTKKLNIAVEDRVPHTNSKQVYEYFVLLKNPTAEFKYYAIRGQKRHVNTRLSTIDASYRQIKIITCVPNAVNLWIRMKEQLRDKIRYKGNYMDLVTLNEEDFLKHIDNINNQKKEIIIDERAM
jgi:hypothetical protein